MVIRENSLEVFDNSKGKALRCLVPVKKHEIIVLMIGEIVDYNDPRVDEYPLQISEDKYLVGNRGDSTEFINHSCDPSCQMLFEGDRVYLAAIKDISPGDELTFDYNTTEFEMGKHAFKCLCGSPNCVGEIKGYKFLTDEEKEKRKPYLAPYLAKFSPLV
jgi:hypothetical protein